MVKFINELVIFAPNLYFMLGKSGGYKEKNLNLTPTHEDDKLDEMWGFDISGNFFIIDTLDEDDDDIGRRI